jgi:hypothetical protein
MVLIAQLALMLLVSTAQAAEPTTLTLACQGTAQWSDDAKPVPTSMGIIIDFAALTLEGFGSDVTFPIRITDITETALTFSGNNLNKKGAASFSINGTIDRVTGAVEAILAGSVPKKPPWFSNSTCRSRASNRAFFALVF